MKVTQALNRPNVKCVLRYRPNAAFRFRYLHPYLSTSFCIDSRAAILANHYNFINDNMAKNFMNNVLEGPIVLWEERRGADLFTISLVFSYYYNEGDLALIFQLNHTRLFNITFSIVPAGIIKIPAAQVLFIGCIHGKSCFDLIKYATKALNDISPATMLLTAARGIATALQIEYIAGISCKDQIATAWAPISFCYDEFWISNGAEKINEGLFLLPSMLKDKPLGLIKINHRSRTKRKRQFKYNLLTQVSRNFEQKCMRKGQRA